jgi:mycothiol synthase
MPARLRPPTGADAPAVLELILARDIADVGAPDFSLEDLEADWSAVALEHDARIALNGDGGVVGYALLLGNDAIVLVHPRAEGAGHGTLLRRWAEARARERGTARLRQYTSGAADSAHRLLRRAGYAQVGIHVRLRAPLAELPPPAAVALRTFEPGDAVAVHRLVEDAFADIDGTEPEPFDRWRARGIGKAGWDPSLWLLMDDEQGLVGAALGERWEGGTGFVRELAVAARARGRGNGRALLLGSFEAFRRAGLQHAELSVHGGNRGALRLYESVGMRPTTEAERWEKPLGG